MIDPFVRSASQGDVDQLTLLASEARDRLLEQRGGRRWLDTHPVPSWDRSQVFVACIDDVVVGYIVLHLDDGLAVIDEVYVTPPARELGFGDALLEAALEHARSEGATTLEGESLPGDRDTKNLYERAGIKARLITVSTPLVGADGCSAP